MTTSTIPREEMGNATGLFNMLRNIGGSIGIAMATTAIIRRAALHQTEIGANLAPSNPVLQQKARADRHRTSATSIGPASARPGSHGPDLWAAACSNPHCSPTSTSSAGPRCSPSSAPLPSGSSVNRQSTPRRHPAHTDLDQPLRIHSSAINASALRISRQFLATTSKSRILVTRINLASAGAGLIQLRGRGVGVFAISLTSLATKENRNGSRQTLPFSYSLFRRIPLCRLPQKT